MRRRTLLVVIAVALTAADLAQKASEPVYGHPRSAGYALLALVILAALVAFVPRVPSLWLSACGGIAAAGALGNLVSALAWSGGVPNPIVVGEVAFNIADACAAAGAVSLVVGSAVFALRHPALLRQPI
jgi:lipoprotein signal peptidase